MCAYGKGRGFVHGVGEGLGGAEIMMRIWVGAKKCKGASGDGSIFHEHLPGLSRPRGGGGSQILPWPAVPSWSLLSSSLDVWGPPHHHLGWCQFHLQWAGGLPAGPGLGWKLLVSAAGPYRPDWLGPGHQLHCLCSQIRHQQPEPHHSECGRGPKEDRKKEEGNRAAGREDAPGQCSGSRVNPGEWDLGQGSISHVILKK